jgi:tRNA (mo5U34)-methyltransferase
VTLQTESTHDAETKALGPWFHNLHLPDGRQTAPDHPLGDFPTFKWRQLEHVLPVDLAGWTALDIGCNAGFYSFQLASRGADVTAIDVDERFLRQARWACALYGLEDRVHFGQTHVYDLARSDARFDLVLFMGVLYHLRYPLLGLDIVADKTRRLLVFQTLTSPGRRVVAAPGDLGITDRWRMRDQGWPTMAFIEHRLEGDATNWWAPNHAAVEAMARSSGLEILERPGHELYVCGPDGQEHDRSELAAATGR